MTSRQGHLCGLAAQCLWLLGFILLMDVSARPANHSSTRERVANKEENEILPPDHLNGVKLEMDGHLNKDFHQEVFLGKDMDGFDEDAEPRRSRRKLMVIFSKVDVNTDRRISAEEMQRWIMEKTAEHFQEAVRENKLHFRAVDPDGDGRVSWDEYKVKFLASKGHNEKEVAGAIKNHEELQVDEESECCSGCWVGRGGLTKNGRDASCVDDLGCPGCIPGHGLVWLSGGPGTSNAAVRLWVLIGTAGPASMVVNREVGSWGRDSTATRAPPEVLMAASQVWGQVELGHTELRPMGAGWDSDPCWLLLQSYMDPLNEHNALNEAKQMIAIADENQNHHLEPEEILKYSEFFTGSKLMDYARNVHEEF
ncbi:PREDICTED: 45 kDa calcium-binding protein [Dipodomys ordii]|uniref:45 kDa calcium-binding protein n=1 Tax=Dipodomys ordii TaxID=10020 RepID=A0A1S3EZN1_DIPOR|nr:PREDICTED: 45 kDa calcium-binding protein [Dipodomys ordii]